MAGVTRRQFIRGASAGVASVAALTAFGVPQAAGTPRRSATARPSATDPEVTSTEPIVAYLRDGSRGEVTIMRGHEEIVRRDPELVRRLLRATR